MKNAAALQGAIMRLIGLIDMHMSVSAALPNFSLGSFELDNSEAWSSLGVVDLGSG